MNIARRNFLTGAVGAALTTNLGGCVIRPPQPVCPDDPRLWSPTTPLTIDAHAHVFNGSDIPVDRVLTVNKKIPGVGPILEALSWNVPTAAEEIAELERLAPYFAACDHASIRAAAAALADQKYQDARTALQNASEAVSRSVRARDEGTSTAIDLIGRLPENYQQYKKAKTVNRLPGAQSRSKLRIDIGGAIDFIVLMFQFRYVIVRDYFEEYSRGPRRHIDLLVAHIVDYDWPLAKGAQTLTPIPEQIEVMSRICRLVGGRVHCYAPFDPFKQVAYDRGLYSTYSPMATAIDAVLNKGCLGIKLYPVMGFRPYGNAERPSAFWRQEWFDEKLLTEDLGQRLDHALAQLYEWCIQYDVPVMAHTSPSNGPSKEFEASSDPEWWKLTLQNFPRLRINFGHFGGYDESATLGREREFASLMSIGQFAAADLGFHPEVIAQPQQEMLDRMRLLYRETAQQGDAALAQRLMYASDWHMLVGRGRDTTAYFDDFIKLYDILDKDPSLGAQGSLSNRFFGWNAVQHLGLRKGDANRARIEAFYASAGVANPQHLAKIDGIAAKAARS